MPENCSDTITSNCCDLSSNGKYKWPTFTISEDNINLLNINLSAGLSSVIPGLSSQVATATPSPTTSSWQSWPSMSSMVSAGESMMESGASNTIQLNKDALQDLLNNDIIKYFNDNLPGYLNCTIKQIGTDLDNNQYDNLINSLKDKVIDTLNTLDLSVLNPLLNNLDTLIVNHINSELTSGSYDTLIDNFLENITNKIITNLNNNRYDNLISKIIEKINTTLNNNLSEGNFDDIFNNFTKKIITNKLFIGIFALVGIGIILLVFSLFHKKKYKQIINKINQLDFKYKSILDKILKNLNNK